MGAVDRQRIGRGHRAPGSRRSEHSLRAPVCDSVRADGRTPRGVAPNTVAAAYRSDFENAGCRGRPRSAGDRCGRPPSRGRSCGRPRRARGRGRCADRQSRSRRCCPDLAPALAAAAAAADQAAATVRSAGGRPLPELAVAGRAGVPRGRRRRSNHLSGRVRERWTPWSDCSRPTSGQGDRVGVEDPGYASVHQVVQGLGLVTPCAIESPIAFGIRPDCARRRRWIRRARRHSS